MARKFDVETVILVVTRIIAAGDKRSLPLSTKGTLEVLENISRLSTGRLSKNELERGGRLDWPTLINELFSNYQGGLSTDLICEICSEVGSIGGRK